MTENLTINRREALTLLSAVGVAGLGPARALAQEQMPLRAIPSTGEMLPVVGLGSSKVVSQIADNGTDPVAAVLRALVANGGAVVDSWPRNPPNDAGYGRVINEPDLRDSLFITTNTVANHVKNILSKTASANRAEAAAFAVINIISCL